MHGGSEVKAMIKQILKIRNWKIGRINPVKQKDGRKIKQQKYIS
jgi:hypothetical protein